MSLFQCRRRRLDGFGAEISGDAFERVREALGRSRGRRPCSCVGDLRRRAGLLLGELAQQFQIKFPVAGRRGSGRLWCRGPRRRKFVRMALRRRLRVGFSPPAATRVFAGL